MDRELLARAAVLLRCPGCQAAALEPAGAALRCGACDRLVPDGGGWLDFLGRPAERPTLGQRLFLNRWGARAYALLRESPVAWLANGRTFRREVELLSSWLALRPDARILDVPCGQGNFTASFARSCPEGLVLALDLSEAQLALARERLRRERLPNVVLVRGSALDLPVRGGAVDAVASCGGLHLYPDVPRAIAEMRRALRAQGTVAGLTFLAHRDAVRDPLERAASRLGLATAFDFDDLGRRFAEAGFSDWEWDGSGVVAYFAARA